MRRGSGKVLAQHTRLSWSHSAAGGRGGCLDGTRSVVPSEVG